jgi:hypothetical protein
MLIDVVVTVAKLDLGHTRHRWIIGKHDARRQPDDVLLTAWGIDPATVIICRRRRMWGRRVWQVEITKKSRSTQ